MGITNYRIKGLTCDGCTCGHCGQPILIYLRCINGIISVNPNFNEDTIEVEYDHHVMSSKDIIKLVKKRGFAINEI